MFTLIEIFIDANLRTKGLSFENDTRRIHRHNVNHVCIFKDEYHCHIRTCNHIKYTMIQSTVDFLLVR
jgi:hypothetical protein